MIEPAGPRRSLLPEPRPFVRRLLVLVEGIEQFTLVLSGPLRCVLSDATGVGTIAAS